MAPETPKKATEAEAKFFFSVLMNMKSKATDVNWEAVAHELNFKSGDVARVRYGQIRRKFGAMTTGEPAPSPKSAGSSPCKVTKATGRVGKRGKAAGGTPKRVKKEECVDDDEDIPEGGSFIKTEEGEAGLGGDSLMNDEYPF